MASRVQQLRDAKPDCAVCGKEVDSVTVYAFEATDEYGVVVTCHGETENMRIQEELVQGSERITIGKAFRRKALPVGTPVLT